MEIKPKYAFFGVIFVLLCIYSLYQARFLILGPEIYIESHRDGEEVYASVITLKGVAKNAAWLSLNGEQIFTDKEGHWQEALILSRGISIMTLAARDRFGRVKSKSIRIIFNG